MKNRLKAHGIDNETLCLSIMANAPSPTVLIKPPPQPPSQLPLAPPLTFSAPPRPAFDQITILNSPPPPFPDPPSSVDFSPLEFLLALVAVVTIPALIYTFIFTIKCPTRRRQHEASEAPSVVSEPSHDGDATPGPAVADLKYRKENHVKEIGTECPVCLSAFMDGEEVKQLSSCKHSFHSSCIDMWLSNHSNCPICRATVVVNKGPNSSSGPGRDADLQQGLPDASNLV